MDSRITDLPPMSEEHTPQEVKQFLTPLIEAHQAPLRKAIETLSTRTTDLHARLQAVEQQQQQRPDPEGEEGSKLIAELLGIQPQGEAMLELFTALAGWRATAPELVQNRTVTNRDGELLYRYADLSALMALVPSLGAVGLSILNFTKRMANGQMGAVVVLVHHGGGAIAAGPWAPRPGEADKLNSTAQREAGSLTTARRILLQFLLNVAADEDPEMGPTAMPPTRRTGPPPPPRRTIESKPPSGPPPGWLSREDRAKLRQEQEDPAITPERFAEIERRLGEAPPAAATTATPAAPAAPAAPPAGDAP